MKRKKDYTRLYIGCDYMIFNNDHIISIVKRFVVSIPKKIDVKQGYIFIMSLIS